jgi:nucleotide-binding universal stress UspA family protein
MTEDSAGQQVVVVGVDGSPESVAALVWAGRYASATGSRIRAVHAWHYPTVAGLPPEGKAPEPVTAEVEQRMREDVTNAMFDAHTDPDLQVETDIVYGHPVEALVRESAAADLLVIGHRGHGAFPGLHIGSVAVHCVTHATCPVVVVRGRPPSEPQSS